MKQTETENEYAIKDLTISALDGEISYSVMIMTFDPQKPMELKVTAVEKSVNVFGSNEQTYLRK